MGGAKPLPKVPFLLSFSIHTLPLSVLSELAVNLQLKNDLKICILFLCRVPACSDRRHFLCLPLKEKLN